ncbi:MAG: MFS transporter [Anaerolineae bacterium]
MTQNPTPAPWRVFLPVSLGTGLSLIGDASLYVVLPTHFQDAAISLAAVGVMLSANRFIRLALNGPVGILYDRLPRRRLFVPALFLGALSTAIYAFTLGFWPLLLGRLLWGIAWVGIWVGGNTLMLDISRQENRGRWVGLYQISFFLGGAGGAILGGFLTDWLGYHPAMGVGAALTLLGAVLALLFLPETRPTPLDDPAPGGTEPLPPPSPVSHRAELGSAFSLLGANRLAISGMLLPTFGLFLQTHLGDTARFASMTLGVATLTGLALGANGLISMVAAPAFGNLSDKTRSRWPVAAGGLLPGVAGFVLLALALPAAPFLAIPLTAVTGGSNQSLATAIIGDLSTSRQRGRRLGILFTVGDFASAVGPPLAYALIPRLGITAVYGLCLAIFSAMFAVALGWSATRR